MAMVRVLPDGCPTMMAEAKVPKLITKTRANAMATPGAIRGNMIRRKTVQGFAPSVRAEFSMLGSIPEM